MDSRDVALPWVKTTFIIRMGRTFHWIEGVGEFADSDVYITKNQSEIRSKHFVHTRCWSPVNRQVVFAVFRTEYAQQVYWSVNDA
jgi:hypothetical protein